MFPPERLLSPVALGALPPRGRLHLVLALAVLLVIRLLQYALIVLDLPLQVRLERAHSILHVHLTHD
jgi:hypothetical protein